ncbi:hypothetical protein LYSHEL_15730 [Lysobacter helvus]|uniref:DUF1415 domain-containing protein n=2 Tax=Lysobacteraceae TaxID=32033 RepID=A0ABM7Q5H1_9GAMM|nr:MULTISPECIES: DUF1415 domain-containing protein [Lysobacter]BCT92549.1 hypothetical protein LYSCAS_15730 [Lysobacter caseinilyticus]BCT95702.1 hypothetical protein LYSHEL_15730 [Lysobacter helvus]
MTDATPPQDPIADTRRWLERAVIGLNLCPFAKAVYVKDQVRFVLSDATTESALLAELGEELALLRDTDPSQIDTTLIVHPDVLRDFLDYNDFLEVADGLVEEMDLDGVLQVASFHPDYRFADSGEDDVENFTNRSPYPTLHLLREDSVSKAVAAFPDPDVIVARNVETLRELGVAGWKQLLAD